jgi:hypothetical protein
VLDRRKRLLDEYEEASHEQIEAAAAKHGARVFAKVRIADALEVNDSGLTGDQYSLALKGHFDFVVVDRGRRVAFAVEFDGHSHEVDPATIARDALKNAICERLGLPLLRIDSSFFRRVEQFSILGWIVEVYFLNRAFEEAQERGEIDPWEIFHYSFVFDWNEQGKLIQAFDPFIRSRARLQRWREKGLCSYPPEGLRGTDPRAYEVSLAIVSLPDGEHVLGIGRCKSFIFPPVNSLELAEELAVLDAAEKVGRHLRGQSATVEPVALADWRLRIERWSGYT